MESMEKIYRNVRDSAYDIIERKGATYYGVAMAVSRITESIIRNEHSVMPVSSYIDGPSGLTDICLSVLRSSVRMVRKRFWKFLSTKVRRSSYVIPPEN